MKNKLTIEKKFSACYQCGVCTGGCPTAKVLEGYNPRKIILKYFSDDKDDKEELLKDSKLWGCTTCHICEDRCPQKIPVGKILTEIKNKATEAGNFQAGIKTSFDLILKTGRAIQISDRNKRIRAQLNLPEFDKLKDEILREIEQIIKDTGCETICNG